MKILFTADVHLKRDKEKRWEALRTVFETAEEKKCDRLVIGGDLFDDVESVRSLAQKLGDEIADDFEIDVDIIPGNHDFKGINEDFFYGRRTRLYTEYERVDFEKEKVSIHFIPFKDKPDYIYEVLEKISNNLGKGKNIVVLHTNLTDLSYSGEEKKYEYMDCELEDFADRGIDLVLAGHIHSGFREKGFKGGKFIYPGSPVSITTKEQAKRNAVLIDTKTLDYEKINLETFHYDLHIIKVDLDTEKKLKELEKELKCYSNKVYLNIIFKGYHKTNENEFREKVEEVVKGFDFQVDLDFSGLRNISYLTETGLYKKFMEKLNDLDLGEKEFEMIRKEFIDKSGGIVYE